MRDYVPERTLTTWLLVDVSASMAFGTADRLKSDVAEGVALVIGRLAVRRAGRVGLLTTGAPAAKQLPPRGGRAQLVALQRALGAGVAPDGYVPPEDALAEGIRRIGRLARGPGLIVVVSDFREGSGGEAERSRDTAGGRRGGRAPGRRRAPCIRPGRRLPRPEWARALGGLAGTHDVLAVEVVDPREGQLPDAGHLVLVDPETGAARRGRLVQRRAAAALRRGRARAPRRAEVPPAARPRPARGGRDRHGLAARARKEPPMSFQAPLFLLGLVAIPLVLLALWAARRRPARYVVRFPAAATLAAVVGKTGRARKIIPPALLCLALAGLVTALARPEATIAVPVERASVMLVTDTSGSMNATDVSPDAPGGRADRREPLPRPRPEVAADRPRGLRRRPAHRAAPDAGPRAGRGDRARRCAPRAGPPPATRSNRR